jgi:hypothetical protein
MEKRFRKQIDYKRKENTRECKKTIFIYCNGKETEPNYFNSFREKLKLSGVKIEVVGLDYNSKSLVDYVIENKPSEYDEIWCVFDKDDFKDFDNAITKAENNKINVAYSNECFELWYYLHFEYLKSALHRDKYEEKLTKKLGQKYEKNYKGMYDILKDKQKIAIKNAKKLENENIHQNKIPSQSNPSTTVYKLVEVLNSLSS